jgi:hypothetical protein
MPREIVLCTCKTCNKVFKRLKYREQTRIKNNKDGPFCSVSCAAKMKSPFKKGEKSIKAILKEKDVKEIRKLFKDGVTIIALSKQTGMSKNCITSVVKKRTWKHVPDC